MILGLVVAALIVTILTGILVGTVLIIKRSKSYKINHNQDDQVADHNRLFDKGLQRSMFSRGMCDNDDNKF
jgi:hypothetical protein